MLSSLIRVRQAVAVSALRASIQSETGSIETTALQLASDSKTLRDITVLFGKTLLRGREESPFCYDDLMAAEFSAILPVFRIERLATVFDPEVQKLADILEMMRENSGCFGLHDPERYTDESGNPDYLSFGFLRRRVGGLG